MYLYIHALAIFLKSYYLSHRTEALFFILGTFPLNFCYLSHSPCFFLKKYLAKI